MTRVMKTKQKTFRVNRRYAEREFAVQKVGELIETRGFEINLHLYKEGKITKEERERIGNAFLNRLCKSLLKIREIEHRRANDDGT